MIPTGNMHEHLEEVLTANELIELTNKIENIDLRSLSFDQEIELKKSLANLASAVTTLLYNIL